MPVPVETLHNIKRLNLVFALSALATAGSMAWMLWADYDRPWRNHQTRYFDVQSAMAHFDWLGYQTSESQEEHRRLREALERAEQELAAQRDLERDLLAKREENSGKLQAATLRFGDLNARIQVTRFEYNELLTLHGDADARTAAKLAQLHREEETLTKARGDKEALEDEQRALRSRLRSFYSARDEARRALLAYEKGINDALQRDRMLGNQGSVFRGLVPARWVLNFPGLDFLAPKGTPGRQEIKQVVLPDVRVEMNFLNSYATDRCTTCHIGIDNPDMTRERFAERLESALRAINEQRVADGDEPLETDPSFGRGHLTLLPFAEMTNAQKDDYLTELTGLVNRYLREKGRAEIQYGQPLLAHPHLDLFVLPDSPHPISRMGCTVCHEGNGQETDFVFASHTPATHEQEHEWAERYYVRRLGVPEVTFHVAHEFWERPMLLPKYSSASCAKCHTEISDLEQHENEPLPSAEALVRGRELFTERGCINCHAVEGLNEARRVGTDLTHVGSKLSTAFMHRWIEFPRWFRPSTHMPHFFHQENNLPSSSSPEDPDPILRTEAEILAITHYLQTFSKPYVPHEPRGDLRGDPARGEKLFTTIGCLACHTNLSAADPSDAQGRSFGEIWIVTDLVQSGLTREEAETRYREMTLNERVDYAMRHLSPERREKQLEVARRERMASMIEGRDPEPAKTYVPPAMSRFAPELSGIGTKLAPDDGDPRAKTDAARWLFDWLRDPQHYASNTTMPRLFRDNVYWNIRDAQERGLQTDQDILDVTEYLLSLRHDTFQPEPIPMNPQHLDEVRRLILHLLAGQNTRSVSESILNDQRMDAGDEFGMLTHQIVRGASRSFGEGEEGRRIVAEMIRDQDLSGRQLLFLGSKMITHYGCFACHSIPGFENAPLPGTELTTWARKLLAQLDFAFFSDGYEEDRGAQAALFGYLYPESAEYEDLIEASGGNIPIDVRHTHASFAYHKMRNPRIWDRAKIKSPYDKLKMPNFFLDEDETTALVTFLLSRQKPFVNDALKVNYGDTPTGRIARGRHLVRELNCVGCHSFEGREAHVHQYFMVPDRATGDIVFDATNAPPDLRGEGAKVQYPWLYGFLNNVEMLRPWLNIRMPAFHLDHEETTRLVEYFVGLSQSEAESLTNRLVKIHEHVGALASSPTAGDKPYWFTETNLEGAAGWLARYGLRNRLVTPFELDTSTAASPGEAAEMVEPAFEHILEKAGFLGRLFGVSYPFDSTVFIGVDEDHYHQGRELFLELKCLACHVGGDPFAEGTSASITAPNFALTHKRLRYDWIRQWLIDPQVIQPGTNMPQLFGGEQSAFKDAPPAVRERLEAKFGSDGREQIRMLVDFLFELGRRNETVVQPPSEETEAAPEPARDIAPEEFEFEFDDLPSGEKNDEKIDLEDDFVP